MAQMKDIPTSILATEGTNVKMGVLSLLEKKGIKMLRVSLRCIEYRSVTSYWPIKLSRLLVPSIFLLNNGEVILNLPCSSPLIEWVRGEPYIKQAL